MRRLIVTMSIMMACLLAICRLSVAQSFITVTPQSVAGWNPSPDNDVMVGDQPKVANYLAEFFLPSDVSAGVPTAGAAFTADFGKPPVVNNEQHSQPLAKLLTPGIPYVVFLSATGPFGTSPRTVGVGPIMVPVLQDPCTISGQTHAITIQIEDWTQSIKISFQGKVYFSLTNAFPIVQLQVKLASNNQVIGEINGNELRGVAALKFSVPSVAGTYDFVVAAKDSTGCAAQTLTQRSFKVS